MEAAAQPADRQKTAAVTGSRAMKKKNKLSWANLCLHKVENTENLAGYGKVWFNIWKQ